MNGSSPNACSICASISSPAYISKYLFSFLPYKSKMYHSCSEDYRYAEQLPTEKKKEDFYINIKSAAESGWDFSSRWFIANGTNYGKIKVLKNWITCRLQISVTAQNKNFSLKNVCFPPKYSTYVLASSFLHVNLSSQTTNFPFLCYKLYTIRQVENYSCK
jgi:hypothetical protein